MRPEAGCRVPPDPRWELDRFPERLEWYERQYRPSPNLLVIVNSWLFTLMDDPYRDARRTPGDEDLWFAEIPGSFDGHDRVVTCSYWILPKENVVRCDLFSEEPPGWPA